MITPLSPRSSQRRTLTRDRHDDYQPSLRDRSGGRPYPEDQIRVELLGAQWRVIQHNTRTAEGALGGDDGQVRGCVGGQTALVGRSESCRRGAMDLVYVHELVHVTLAMMRTAGKKR
jgi:hypothetical protein